MEVFEEKERKKEQERKTMEKKPTVTKVRKWAPVITAADTEGNLDTGGSKDTVVPSLDVDTVPIDWAAAVSIRRSPSGSSGRSGAL